MGFLAQPILSVGQPKSATSRCSRGNGLLLPIISFGRALGRAIPAEPIPSSHRVSSLTHCRTIRAETKKCRLQDRTEPSPVLRIYQQPVFPWPRATRRLVAITGLSQPSCCCLHPEISSFLAEIAGSDPWSPRNFPFTDCLEPATNPTSSDGNGENCQPRAGRLAILTASIANAEQFLRCGHTQRVQQALPHWLALRRRTDHLMVVAGSCGLELVRQFELARLTRQQATDAPVLVDQETAAGDDVGALQCLALGPVARDWPGFAVCTIQGNNDWVSRWFFKRALANRRRQQQSARPPTTAIVRGVGHMDYWRDSQVKAMAAQWLATSTFE